MRVPFELDFSPARSSSTPAFASSSLYFIIAAISVSAGMTPASESLLALTIIMKRIGTSPQSSIAWYAKVQKSRHTSGGTGEVHARWVNRTPTNSSRGSVHHVVPKPPDQPNVPTDPAKSTRRVTTDTPKPQPWLLKKLGPRPDTDFCSGVS